MNLEPMSIDNFWRIIDGTTEGGPERKVQYDRLVGELSRLDDPTDILRFAIRFYPELRRSDTEEISAASDIMHGEVSDDLFTYFRLWIMSKGRRVYEAAINDPDTLATLEDDRTDQPTFWFETFSYAESEAYKNVTGNDIDYEQIFACTPKSPTPERPKRGEGIDRSDAGLKSRFPALWAKYKSWDVD